VEEKDFDMTLAGAAHPPLERTVLNMYTHSEGIGNYGNYSDSDVDALIEEFFITNDGPEATALFQQVTDHRLENVAPQVILVSQKNFCLLSDKVNGWDGRRGLDWFFHTMYFSE
jgi:ABC-type transport system substrate-binding protein